MHPETPARAAPLESRARAPRCAGFLGSFSCSASCSGSGSGQSLRAVGALSARPLLPGPSFEAVSCVTRPTWSRLGPSSCSSRRRRCSSEPRPYRRRPGAPTLVSTMPASSTHRSSSSRLMPSSFAGGGTSHEWTAGTPHRSRRSFPEPSHRKPPMSPPSEERNRSIHVEHRPTTDARGQRTRSGNGGSDAIRAHALVLAPDVPPRNRPRHRLRRRVEIEETAGPRGRSPRGLTVASARGRSLGRGSIRGRTCRNRCRN